MLEAEIAERVRVTLLGPFEVRQGDRLLTVRARKDRALLGVLAVSNGRSVPRTRLAGLLWGESREDQARESLKQALMRLRRVGGDEPLGLIEADREHVALAQSVETDAGALLMPFDETSAEAALALRRGPFLDGLDIGDPGFRDWLLAERARLDAVYADLALRHMHRAEAAGRSAAAASIARQLLSADPFNEDAVRTLMRAEMARGQQRLALQVYEEARERVARGLGIEPEPETMELAAQIRAARGIRAATAATPPVPPSAREAGPSVGVLPFAAIGGDPAQDYFADGLAEDIITDLGKVGGIHVVARGASFALKGLGPAEAARILGVSHVLQGSVRQEGAMVRVTARLVAAPDGQQVWASRYDRPMTDIFRLQDDLSRSVVTALSGALSPPGGFPVHRGTGDVEAYRLHLKARSFYLRGLDRHSLATARLLLLQAIERDPAYAAAHALLATCEFYISMRLTSLGRVDPSECRKVARKAVTLDPALAEARAALGLAHYAEGRYADAETELAEASRLDADLFEPPFFLARNYRLRGERAEAARLYARAAALRPEDYRSCGLLAEELRATGRTGDATNALLQAVERLDAAIDLHPDNTDALAFGAAIHAELGDEDRAREWCRWALVIGDDENLVHFNYNLARAFVLLGQPAEALERLERMLQAPDVVRTRVDHWLASDLAFAPMRDGPAFAAFLDRLRPDRWRG